MENKAYLKAVGKNLELPWPLKRRLLSGLRQELEEKPGLAELEPPGVMAEQLMDGVESEIKERFRRRRKYAVRFLVVFLIAFMAIGFAYFIRMEQTQVERVNVYITEDAAPQKGE